MTTNDNLYLYKIYRSDSGLSDTFSLVGTSDSVTFSDSSAIVGRTYYYYITTLTRYISGDFITYQESPPGDIFSISYQNNLPIQVIPIFSYATARGPIPDNEHRIGTYDYIYAAEKISEAYDLGRQSLSPLICMFNTLNKTDVNAKQRHKMELESFLRKTYAYIIFKHLDNQQSTYNAIRSLNEHVLREYGEAYGYESLDEFLIDQFLEVPLTYAILSEQAGYTITVIGDSKARLIDINSPIKDITLPFNKIGWENL